MQLGIIGTGKLGGPVSEALAESAAQVHAYDIAGGENIPKTPEGGSRKYYDSIEEVVKESSIVLLLFLHHMTRSMVEINLQLN